MLALLHELAITLGEILCNWSSWGRGEIVHKVQSKLYGFQKTPKDNLVFTPTLMHFFLF